MAHIAFVGMFPKEPEHPQLNEDYCGHNEAGDIIVVSDGASESYDSRTWARLLVRHYLERPAFDAEWLNEAIRAYGEELNFSALTWSQQAAMARGNYATFLAAKCIDGNRAVEIFGVGDSIAILINSDKFETSFPIKNSSEFAAHPLLLSTRPEANDFLNASNFASRHSARFDTDSTSTLLLMTDAIGAWCLSLIEEGDDKWRTLLTVNTTQEYEALIVRERETRRMRIDDTTLVRLSFSE